MKKKYYYAVGILSIFLLCPLVIGYFFEKKYEATLQTVASNAHIQLKLLKYNRGLFTAHAVVATNYPLTDTSMPLNPTDNNALIIHQTIYFGPIILSENKISRLKLRLVDIDSFFDPEHHFANLNINLVGQLNGKLALENFSTAKPGRHHFYTIHDLAGEFSLSPLSKRFSSSIKCGQLTTNIYQPRTIEDFRADHNLAKNQYGAWLGTSQYHFGQLIWQQESNLYEFDNFDTRIDSKIINGKVIYQIDNNIMQASYNHINYGPQMVSLAISNLDPSTLSTLISPPATKEPYKQLIQLLNKGAQLSLNNIILNTPFGPLRASGSFSCPCEQHAHEFAEIFAKTTSQLNATVPTELFKSALIEYFKLSHNLNPSEATSLTNASLEQWQKAGWLVTTSAGARIYLKWQPDTKSNNLN